MPENDNENKIYIPAPVKKTDFNNLVNDVRALEGKIVYSSDPNGPSNPTTGMVWLKPVE